MRDAELSGALYEKCSELMHSEFRTDLSAKEPEQTRPRRNAERYALSEKAMESARSRGGSGGERIFAGEAAEEARDEVRSDGPQEEWERDERGESEQFGDDAVLEIQSVERAISGYRDHCAIIFHAIMMMS